MNSYLVIGLGRFGREMAEKLYACGEEVLAVDTDETLVDRIADKVTRAVAADAKDQEILRRLGAENFDRAVVAIGSDIAASALITMNLKALQVPYIICKAQDDIHRQILERLGADRVVIPEREMADKLSLGLASAGIMEYIELSDEYGIAEVSPESSWVGKTIRALELRTRYGINVIALRQQGQLTIPPDIEAPLTHEDILVILGSYDAINSLKEGK